MGGKIALFIIYDDSAWHALWDEGILVCSCTQTYQHTKTQGDGPYQLLPPPAPPTHHVCNRLHTYFVFVISPNLSLIYA